MASPSATVKAPRRTDLYTPQTTVDLLTYWTHRPDFERFRAALPILGVDGSLAVVQADSPAKGHVFAKTGTLVGGDFVNDRAVLYNKALAGYIDARDGPHVAFTAVVNNSPLPPDFITGVLDENNDLGAIAAAIWNKPKGSASASRNEPCRTGAVPERSKASSAVHSCAPGVHLATSPLRPSP